MTATISTYLADKLLDHAFGTTAYTEPTVYVGLFTTDPTMPAGTGGTEVSGGSYARVEVTGHMTAASSGANASSADITFATATASWGTVTGLGIFDASTSGNLLWAAALTGGSVAVNSGDTPKLSSGNLAASLS